jgi:L-malate glycosyltransferase
VKRPVVVHIIDALSNGGAENILCHSINGLDQFYNILIYLYPSHELKPMVRADEIIFLNCKGKRGFPAVIFRLKRILTSRKAIAIHSHSYWTNILSRLAASKKVKVFNSYHFADYGTMHEHSSVKRMIKLDNFTFNKNVQRIAVSEYVRSILQDSLYKSDNVVVLPNFIADEYLNSNECLPYRPRESLKIIAVGNIKREKNYDLLIEALNNLRYFDISLDIYGGGHQLENYRKKAAALNLSNLRFMGPSANIHNLLPQYHLYLMSSFSEACPLSPIQAMPCGMPVILSNIPSLKEIFNDKAIYFRNNDVLSLCDKLQQIYEGKIRLQNHKHGYQDILHKYTKRNYINLLSGLYCQASESSDLLTYSIVKAMLCSILQYFKQPDLNF